MYLTVFFPLKFVQLSTRNEGIPGDLIITTGDNSVMSYLTCNSELQLILTEGQRIEVYH